MAFFKYLAYKSFNLGWFTYTDETKFQMFLFVKAFLIIYFGVEYADDFKLFDFNLKDAHKLLNSRINQALYAF